jgi:hypothetical protein
MRITEKKLRNIIRYVLAEAVVRPKARVDHKFMFDQWLHTVFLGVEDNFRPYVKAVYKTKSKQDRLLARWMLLKSKKNQTNEPLEVFYEYISNRVENNGDLFKKEMLGDFFMDNDVNPYDIFYYLKYFIKPKKDFSKFNKNKIPSSTASSKDFAIEIDVLGWDMLKSVREKYGNERLDLNNLQDKTHIDNDMYNDDSDEVLKRFCKLIGIDFNDKRALANYFSDQAASSGVDSWGNRLPKIDTYEEQ